MYLFKGDYDHAIADCDEAIRRNLRDSATYNNRGFANLKKGSSEKAICDLNEAIRLDPKACVSYVNLGKARCIQRNYDGAIAALDEAIRIDPRNLKSLRLRSEAYSGKGEWEKALVDVNEVVHLDPSSSEGYRQRASIYAQEGETDRAVKDFTEAIRLAPKRADAYTGRSTCLARLGRYDKAIADLDIAIELSPNSPCLYEARGAWWIAHGDFDRGAADIEKAIQLNPNDPAAHFEAWAKLPVGEVAIEHGKQQVRRMLQDRPVMAQYSEQSQVLRDWATRKFAGEDLGRVICWDASEPPPYATGVNYPFPKGRSPFIRVSKVYGDGRCSRERSFEDLWRDAVFELYNIANAEDVVRLTKDAKQGRLLREEFVAKTIECESRAAEKTRSFYIHVFMPWAKQRHAATNPGSWFLASRSDPSENLLRLLTEKDAWWRAYERWYDSIVVGDRDSRNRGEDMRGTSR